MFYYRGEFPISFVYDMCFRTAQYYAIVRQVFWYHKSHTVSYDSTSHG